MTKHILVAGKLHPSALRVLDSAEGVSFDYVPDADPTAYLPLLPKAQGLVLRLGQQWQISGGIRIGNVIERNAFGAVQHAQRRRM